MVEEQALEQEIFEAVRKLDSPESRSECLERMCGQDLELKARVEALLRAYTENESFLESPPFLVSETSPTEAFSISEQPGDMIGPYKLLQQIGEGGMGVVYMAEQTEPVARRVALKIIKPGMDTRQVIARFEAERQALAMMDHPNIAKVFDAGATDNGRPYFVMELVKGVPITDYCDECNIPTDNRLSLFVSVCQSVQHAHQKGIIHRDLKPSNILIALQDDIPSPKIIDFGIAKATGQKFTDVTQLTTFTQVLGTPLYMSPEQAELKPLGVDTRTDIYSLGVLLYELLTGMTPFDKERLRTASFDELRKIIREEDPPRPSARFSTCDAQLATTIADRHRTVRDKLLQRVRGDLDWIVMKCLDKDRSRRYASASALADDVSHYLRNEPVKAYPASTQYRLKKLVARNKQLVISGGLLFLTLVALICLMYFRLRSITTQLELEHAQRVILEKERSQNQAEERARIAELEKTKAHVDALIEEALRVGSGVAPDFQRADQLLTDAIRLRPNDPRLKLYRGSMRYEQGKYGESIKDLKDAVAEQPENLPSAHWLIALAAKNMGDEETFGRHRLLAAQQAPDSVDSLVVQALAMPYDERGIDYLNQAIEKSPFDPLLYFYRGRAAYNLTFSSAKRKWYEMAIRDLEKALIARPRDDRIRDALSRCYVHFFFLADPRTFPLKRAQWLLSEWMAQKPEEVLPHIIEANLNLAKGDSKQAVDTCLRALRMSPESAEAYCICGWSYCRLKDFPTAISYFSEALENTPQSKISERISILAGRGMCYARLNQNKSANRDLQEASSITHRNNWKVYNWLNLIRAFEALGDINAAEELCSQSVERFPDCSLFLLLRGEILSHLGRVDEALVALRQANELSPGVQVNYTQLLHCLFQTEAYSEAETWCNRWLDYAPSSNEAHRWLGLIQLKRGEYHKAIGSLNAALAFDPEDSKAYLYRGRALAKTGRLQKGLVDLNKACELDSEDPEVYHLRADTLYELKRYSEAAKDLTKCLTFEPEESNYYYLRGDCLRRMGKSEKALADLEKAISLDSKIAKYYDRRGLVREDMGLSDLAILDYRKALQINPLEKYVNTHLINALQSVGNNSSAVAQCKIWQQADPDSEEPWVAEAEIWRSLGENQKALASCGEAIKRDPNAPGAYFCRGRVYMSLGQPLKASQEYDRALEKDPEFVAVYHSRGLARRALGLYQEAIQDLTRAINIGTKDRWIFLGRSECYRQLHKYESALTDIDLALQNDCDKSTAIMYRSRIFNAQTKYHKALKEYYSLLSYDPVPAYTYQGIIITHAALGDWKNGIEFINRWIEEEPTNHKAFHFRGYLLYLSGDYLAALEDFGRTEELKPEDYLTEFYRGLTLFALNQPEKGRVALQHSSELCPPSRLGEHQYNLGEAFAQLDEWQIATQYLAKSVNSRPHGLAASRLLALAQLQLHDNEGYEETCEALRRELGQAPPPTIAQQIASTCALGSIQKGGDQLLALANLALENIPEHSSTHCTLGAVLFRLGMESDAIKHLSKAELLISEESSPAERAIIYAYKAMAHKASKESSLAEEYLEKAFAIDLTWPLHAFRGTNKLPNWLPYREAEILRSEAGETIRGKNNEREARTGKSLVSTALADEN